MAHRGRGDLALATSRNSRRTRPPHGVGKHNRRVGSIPVGGWLPSKKLWRGGESIGPLAQKKRCFGKELISLIHVGDHQSRSHALSSDDNMVVISRAIELVKLGASTSHFQTAASAANATPPAAWLHSHLEAQQCKAWITCIPNAAVAGSLRGFREPSSAPPPRLGRGNHAFSLTCGNGARRPDLDEVQRRSSSVGAARAGASVLVRFPARFPATFAGSRDLLRRTRAENFPTSTTRWTWCRFPTRRPSG